MSTNSTWLDGPKAPSGKETSCNATPVSGSSASDTRIPASEPTSGATSTSRPIIRSMAASISADSARASGSWFW